MRSKFKEIKRRYTLINLRVSKALVGEFVKKKPSIFVVSSTDGRAFMVIIFPVKASVQRARWSGPFLDCTRLFFGRAFI